MPARSVCLVTLSLSEAGPGRFGRQVSVTDLPCHAMPVHLYLRVRTTVMHAHMVWYGHSHRS